MSAIQVFDVLGRRVAELPGTAPTVLWDGTDTRGHRVPPGTYFLQIPGHHEPLRVVRLSRSP